ncbi:glycosyltransferase [Pelagicoccus albus]|uniref:Glycosyltransferase family 2 protein n=1 Tax=Pelagicoccus albus TaxID=415222 RepID=A0A7X1B566_9BACT|nr:glycosyltransferase family 2 protein [Pelagicoccus albus]
MNQTETSNRLSFATDLSETEVEVSVVVPLLNEEGTLAALTEGVFEALLGKTCEILFVDDGSRDGSWSEIRKLSQRFPNSVRGFRHRRNFGKAEALATGFAHAKGQLIVTMDADLQDDPLEIPALLAKLDEGYDLVSGWKRDRHDPISKTIPSRFFNYAARVASGLSLHDFNCGLKAYRREVVESLHLYGELHRFTPILSHGEGYRVTEIPVTHHPREQGKSKYGWTRFFKGSLDLLTVILLTRYLQRPGHFFGAIGFISGAFGLGILSYLSAAKIFFGVDIGTRPLFFLGILATLFSAQLITTGFTSEFLLRVNSSERPGHRISESTKPPSNSPRN